MALGPRRQHRIHSRSCRRQLRPRQFGHRPSNKSVGRLNQSSNARSKFQQITSYRQLPRPLLRSRSSNLWPQRTKQPSAQTTSTVNFQHHSRHLLQVLRLPHRQQDAFTWRHHRSSEAPPAGGPHRHSSWPQFNQLRPQILRQRLEGDWTSTLPRLIAKVSRPRSKPQREDKTAHRHLVQRKVRICNNKINLHICFVKILLFRG